MHSDGRIPIQNNTYGRRFERHYTARYYFHRVQESLTTRISKLVCAIFLTLLLIVAIITFILWLSLRPHRPRFHVHDFSIPGLSQPSGFGNAQVIFNVTTRNPNQNVGFYYDAMLVALYYRDQNIGGATLLFPFTQGPKNTTVLYGVLINGATLTVNNQRWMQFQADLGKGAVVFRFDVTSTIRFKISTWYSRRHKMHANCEVKVGPDGSILASYREKRCPEYFSWSRLVNITQFVYIHCMILLCNSGLEYLFCRISFLGHNDLTASLISSKFELMNLLLFVIRLLEKMNRWMKFYWIRKELYWKAI